MEVIPAIDLKGGQCVRLSQGDMDKATVYSDSPGATAQRWIACGAQRMHLVDLDGAIEGKPANEPAIREIVKACGPVPTQLGGGIRDMKRIATWLEAGVGRVILGTIAAENPALVREACRTFPGRVAVGIDAKDGRVAVKGWVEVTGQDAVDLARQFEDAGVAAIIYTDIARDGMLTGPNIEQTRRLAKSVKIPVIASGGVASLDDIRALKAVEADGIAGVITGRAIYTGKLDLAEAIRLAQ